MFKYQLKFINTGEIVDSDYIYKFPHTAKRAAFVHLREQLNRGYHGSQELGRCEIFREGTEKSIIDFGGKSIPLQELLDRLEGWKAYMRGRFR